MGARDDAELALQVVDRIPGAEAFIGWTLLFLSSTVHHWIGFLTHTASQDLHQSFYASVSHGDLNFAYYAVFGHLFTQVAIG